MYKAMFPQHVAKSRRLGAVADGTTEEPVKPPHKHGHNHYNANNTADEMPSIFLTPQYLSLSHQVAWKDRKPLAAFVGSCDPYRQVLFDQSRMAPEQLKVIFSFHPNCHIKPTNPDSPEKEISLKDVEKFSKEEIEKAGRDKQAYPAGYALPLLTVGGPSGGHYNPAEFKYVIVTLGSYGRSTSGRLAGILAHSGAVVMLEKTPFFYHFSARMQPWVHYVPISYSMADIVEKVKWLQQHDDLAQRIVINAKHFARSYLRMEDYYCYAATSLETLGQIMITSDVLQPFNAIKLYSGYPGYSS